MSAAGLAQGQDAAFDGEKRRVTKRRAVFNALDRYLRLLDGAPISTSGLFRSLDDKEKYETHLMYVFRKYEAARYHLANVRRHLQRDREDLKPGKPAPTAHERPKVTVTTSSLTISAHHYAYELAAFLGALKSALDFSAAACAPHMTGIKTDKISTFIRLVKSGQTGPVYDAVRRSLPWLERLTQYRHHLVHRLVTPTHTSRVSKTIGEATVTAVAPVVVPRDPPRYVPDTRRAATADGLPLPGMMFCATIASAVWSGRRQETVNHSASFSLLPGYEPIDDFMEEHLRSFEKYFVSLLADLERMGFNAGARH